MSDPVHEKVQKLYDSRAKAEADLNRYQKDVTEAETMPIDESASNGWSLLAKRL